MVVADKTNRTIIVDAALLFLSYLGVSPFKKLSVII